MELTRCPQCGILAEVVDREVWPSTDGPVEHAHVRCVAGHRFVLPVELLARLVPTEPALRAEPRAARTPRRRSSPA